MSSGDPGPRARAIIEEAYRRYHHPSYIHPDPLEIVRRYEDPADREVAALLCASLALGRVKSVMYACESALSRLAPVPTAADSGTAAEAAAVPPRPPRSLAGVVRDATLEELRARFDGFVYRFFGREEMAHFVFALGEALRRRGSLEAAFLAHLSPGDETVLAALGGFSAELSAYAAGIHGLLFAQVDRGSAAKRWHLFLRWLVRHDAVDPGGWTRVPTAKLVVPMDTHMHSICRELGILTRRSPDGKAALEITGFFRAMEPGDPARFDFSLTRLGIHPDAGRERAALLGADGYAFSTQT